jgi:hypothetical protein
VALALDGALKTWYKRYAATATIATLATNTAFARSTEWGISIAWSFAFPLHRPLSKKVKFDDLDFQRKVWLAGFKSFKGTFGW